MSENTPLVPALDRVFSEFDRDDAPGAAVGVIREGEILYRRGFGLASVEHRVPNTTTTVFDIGSITKQFTAFAILLLEQEGALGLDDDVRAIVPELPAYDPPVRIRHCLYHTCGLSDRVGALEFTGPSGDYCLPKRAFRTIYALGDTLFAAGKQHAYSNTGYVLLAKIVARVSGMPLPEYLRVQVFGPLGMSSSAFLSDPDQVLPNQAQGYYPADQGEIRRAFWLSSVHGDGGMLTSVDDIILWLENIDTVKVGDRELLRAFFAPGRLDDGRPLRYAAGWELDRYRGLRAVRHGGLAGGFQTHIVWFPEPRLGIVILGNLRPCWPWRLANRVADVCVADRFTIPPAVLCPPPSDPAVHSSYHDLVGRYFAETGLLVSVCAGKTGLELDAGFMHRSLRETSADVFASTEDGEAYRFHRNVAGKITHFTVDIDHGACPRYYSLHRATRFEYVTLSDGELAEFEGRYISDELETIYTLAATEGGLTARHLRCYDWQLRPIKSRTSSAYEDQFTGKGDWPGVVTFERNTHREPVGFRVRNSTVNLFFRGTSVSRC